MTVKTVNATRFGGTHISNLSTQETESEGWRVQGQPSLHSEPFLEKELQGSGRRGKEGGRERGGKLEER